MSQAKLFASLRLVGQFLLLVVYDPALVILEMNILRLLISWVITITIVVFRSLDFLSPGVYAYCIHFTSRTHA